MKNTILAAGLFCSLWSGGAAAYDHVIDLGVLSSGKSLDYTPGSGVPEGKSFIDKLNFSLTDSVWLSVSFSGNAGLTVGLYGATDNNLRAMPGTFSAGNYYLLIAGTAPANGKTTIAPSPVPEPETWALMLTGCALLRPSFRRKPAPLTSALCPIRQNV